MAIKKNGFNITNVLASAGGGAAVNVALDMLEDKVEMFQEKPVLGPMLMEGVGLALSYFGSGQGPLDAAGKGIIGAATSELMALRKSQQGFSRVNIQNKRNKLSPIEKASLKDRVMKARSKRMQGFYDNDTYGEGDGTE